MGATLPLLALVLNDEKQSLGSKVALLYFANTAGATFGALLTSYAIIPFFGVHRTTLIAATLNLLVSLGAIEIAKHLQNTPPAPEILGNSKNVVHPAFSKKITFIALSTLCLGGILSLGLEVVYVHMLSIVAGNSVYAFGLMLATFLLGLACGGEGARRLLLDSNRDRTRLLAFAFLGLSFSAASGVWFWNDIPDYFASFVDHPAARSFSAREAIRGLVCAMIMLPPTLFIGAAYVLGMDIITAVSRNGSVKMLGVGAALNTFGNIAGVLIFGFFLIPVFGGLQSTRIIAISAFALAVIVLLFRSVRPKQLDLVWALGVLFAVLGSFQVQLNYDALSSGANVYFAGQQWGKVIAHAESIDGGLTTVTEQPGNKIKTLLTNGKFQGTDSWNGEMQAQIGFAFAPLLHQEKRDRALVIGYGTGVTSRVFHDAGFKQLDIAELSNDVINLANNYFPEVNSKVSTLNNVNLHVTDGRNLLLLTPPQHLYDVVSIEITSIWFAGAASLYNKEFYDLVRSRMNTDGVLQQWVQLHRLSPIDILTIISTLRSSFNYVSLYVIGGQGILIATNDADRKSPNLKAIHLLENTAQLNDIKSKFNKKIPDLIENRSLSSAGVDQFIKKTGVDQSLWISTDDNLRLEYSTPKANVNDAQISMRRNLEMLQKFNVQK
jgi:spermidine synthase